MRLGHLLLLTLFFGFAFVQPSAAQDRAAPSRHLNFDWRNNPDVPNSLDFLQQPAKSEPGARSRFDARVFVRRAIQRPDDERRVCYVINTYRMARVDSSPDVVEPAGYSVCHEASAYGLRNAVIEVP